MGIQAIAVLCFSFCVTNVLATTVTLKPIIAAPSGSVYIPDLNNTGSNTSGACNVLSTDQYGVNSSGTSYAIVKNCDPFLSAQQVLVGQGWNVINYCVNKNTCNGYFPGLLVKGASCPSGYFLSAGLCYYKLGAVIPEKNIGPNLCVGNPINAGTAGKYQIEQDWVLARQSFERYYNSSPSKYRSVDYWLHSYQRSLLLNDWDGAVSTVMAMRQNGQVFFFSTINGLWQSDSDISHRLIKRKDSVGNSLGWTYYNADNEENEEYDIAGKLLTIKQKSGEFSNLIYTDGTDGSVSGAGGFSSDSNGSSTNTILPAGLLLRVSDTFNRSANFSYNATGLLVKIILPNGESFLYTYNALNNVANIVYPDNKVRTYHYENAAFPNALTGITDENGNRFATYQYDSTGRAISTAHAGGVDQYQINYGTNSSTVTDPLGTARTTNFTTILGVIKSTGQSQPGGSGCGPAASAISYDTNGNVATRTDFNGTVTSYSYDLSRNLETSRIEASGTANARTITTTWHSTYRLPLVVAEPLRRTTYTYDTSGNQLSKTVQATSDATGAQGVSGTAVGTPRIWSNTYNNVGQVLTATGPRTDIVDVTTYAYDTMGNLVTVTNALNQTTTLSNYDLNGRVGRITDSNGTITDLTYSPRGWLTSKVTTAGATTETTSYTYDGVGQMTKVTLPDGAYIDYTYDAAHRLTTISDSAGNSIVYTLDAMGNRTNEQVKDPNGQLAKQTTRVIDALNRVQQITGPGSQQ